jgi:hypothetical protein
MRSPKNRPAIDALDMPDLDNTETTVCYLHVLQKEFILSFQVMGVILRETCIVGRAQ